MLFLFICWIIYFVLHSLLAADAVKHWFKTFFNLHGRQYRLAYNLLNLFILPAVLYLHYITSSTLFFKTNGISVAAGLLVVLCGSALMFAAAKAYDLPVFFGFKQETKMPLQISGLHQFVRHPLYAGTLLLCIGICILFPYWKNAVVLLLMFIYILIGIELEERKLVAAFGDKYKHYQKKVKRLIPGLL